MLISICIPQYNRIKFLLASLETISLQSYPELEIVISDDGSTDDTEHQIRQLQTRYKYPIVYARNTVNLGYDRNLRASIEMASGDYILILGNDDTINPDFDMQELANFIQSHARPSVGFINYLDAGSGAMTRRAQFSGLLGSGPEVALKHYSCFSFVAGIVFKRSTFLQYNTSKFDGSIYAQIYLACLPVAQGEQLFCIEHPLIIKDILPEAQDRKSYNDVLPRTWKDYKKLDGGLPSVLHVVLSVFRDTSTLTQHILFRTFRKIYLTTLPFWILEYKKQKALPAAVGIFLGLKPSGMPSYNELNLVNKLGIQIIYGTMSIMALLFPVILFDTIKPALYNLIKR